ncbi:AAA family ATPase [Methylomagnum ishizawai]|uniref:AAA family ATPase n=1 Tax=Methylomagnum ishizawai TaxID=1760988 RepID=UPI001C32F087|nr:AAA family ATPase [Methylomagnum ishizawai]BBL75124.1 chromosome segregation protein SMC [Methylomagnum ishizawai]
MRALRRIKIEGFKSIAGAELELGDLNVVIGANGSGKSNLIGVFRLLERIWSRNLQLFVAGEPDRLLHHGRKVTPFLAVGLELGQNRYEIRLKAERDVLVFEQEQVWFGEDFWEEPASRKHLETALGESGLFFQNRSAEHFFPLEWNWLIHHFHDTSDASPAKQICNIDDNRYLRPDAANLAAYLYWLQEKHPVEFRHIEEHIRLVAPFFEGFVLAPSRLNERKIKLEWRHKGSDAYFDAYSLSDGTLRFICLATLLLQPTPPALILLDEPELGLHPFAIRLLAEMLEAASHRSQVILATQSVNLLDQFSPKDIIVAENDGKQTTFRRLDEDGLRGWLDEYSLGELWTKNVLGGQP